jgi:hypothetical protein
MMMSFGQYLVKQFNEKADNSDKVKINLFTLFDTAIATLLSVQGMVSFFNITNNLIPIILVIIFATGYFNLFRLWHVCRTMIGCEQETPDEIKDTKKG